MKKKFDLFILLAFYTDSKSLLDSIVGLNATTEKWLLIDLTMLRKSYEVRKLPEAVWIPSSQNPADALENEKCSPALKKLMKTCRTMVSRKLYKYRPVDNNECSRPARALGSNVLSLQLLLTRNLPQRGITAKLDTHVSVSSSHDQADKPIIQLSVINPETYIWVRLKLQLRYASH